MHLLSKQPVKFSLEGCQLICGHFSHGVVWWEQQSDNVFHRTSCFLFPSRLSNLFSGEVDRQRTDNSLIWLTELNRQYQPYQWLFCTQLQKEHPKPFRVPWRSFSPKQPPLLLQSRDGRFGLVQPNINTRLNKERWRQIVNSSRKLKIIGRKKLACVCCPWFVFEIPTGVQGTAYQQCGLM